MFHSLSFMSYFTIKMNVCSHMLPGSGKLTGFAVQKMCRALME